MSHAVYGKKMGKLRNRTDERLACNIKNDQDRYQNQAICYKSHIKP